MDDETASIENIKLFTSLKKKLKRPYILGQYTLFLITILPIMVQYIIVLNKYTHNKCCHGSYITNTRGRRIIYTNKDYKDGGVMEESVFYFTLKIRGQKMNDNN